MRQHWFGPVDRNAAVHVAGNNVWANDVGARSDLYSLGVLLYEMLAGRPPFVDPLRSALLIKQATAPAPPLPKLRPDIMRPLALAVHTLLAKRPDDRPRTAAIAKAILERSITQPERTLPDMEPLSAMVAAADARTQRSCFASARLRFW